LTDGTASAADYNNASIVVSFPDDRMSQNVQIPIIDDTLAESRETINLALGNPTGCATIKARNTAVLTIVVIYCLNWIEKYSKLIAKMLSNY
jgi:hypothetical protein